MFRPLISDSSRLLVFAISALPFSAVPAAAAPWPQAGFTQTYFVCYEFNGAPNKDYYSAVFTDPGDYGKMSNGFEDYVATKYHEPKRIPTCPAYHSVKQAEDALNQRVALAKGRAVETGWTPTGVVAPSSTPAPAATTAAPPASAAASPAPKPAPAQGTDKGATTGGSTTRYMFCWTIMGDYRAYFSPSFSLDGINPQKVNIEFVAYIRKTYGGNPSAQCPASVSIADSDGGRQNQIDELKRSTPKTQHLTITNVDWTPTPAPATSSAPASTGVPSAPKPSALDAYQQALAAQRPNGVAASQQMFCYAAGAQQGGAGKAQIYVSKIFAAAPASQPGVAFQTYLRGAHGGEVISTATCPTAPDADTLQGTRQEYIDNQRKIPTRAVVEVDWKGGQ